MSPEIVGCPLGAGGRWDGGVNFSLFSRAAMGLELLFFDREHDAKLLASPCAIPSRTGRTTTGMSSCRG